MLLGEVQRKIETYDIVPDIGELPEKKPKTKMELTNKRTRNSTRFINPDGSFTEEIYNQPIFYQDISDKKWKRIDNTLKKSPLAPDKFINTANEFKSIFAEESDISKLVSVQKQGYNLDMLLVGARKVKSVINNDEIIYPDILPQVDLSYVVTNDKIKESLILKTPTGQSQYSFELKIPANLTESLLTNGNITISSQFGDLLWILEKPRMIDSNGIYSDNAYFNIRKEGNRTFIDIILDTSYLNNPSRSYPVTIDPSFQSTLLIRDTFISNRYPQSSYSSSTYMHTGMTPSYGVTRSLIRFALPPLPSNSRITTATFQAYQTNTGVSNTTVDLYRLNSSWGDAVTWDTQPLAAATAESSLAPNTYNAFWVWYITKLTQDWYNGVQSNYGLMLRNRDESTAPWASFTTKENTATYVPKISITYEVDPIGLEDYWHQTEEGINPSNGNLTLSETDFVISGRGTPLTIERTYNSRNTIEKGLFGYGWSSNLDVRLNYAASGPVVYTDGDGTRHFFGEAVEGGYIAQSGSYLNLTRQSDGIFILTLEDKTTNITFNNNGRIQSITDLNGNVTTFTYSLSGQLQSIKDASNRTISISYGSSGYISTITVETRSYRYLQDANGYLTSYTNAKNITKNYVYDVIGRLTGRKDGRSITTSFTYDASSRVSKVSRPITIEGTASESVITFSYDPVNTWSTRYSNINQRTDYSYDSLGRVKQIIENITDPVNKKTSIFSFSDNNEVVQVLDPKNQSYVYEYDDQGNLTSEKLPENQMAYYTFDNQNNLITEQDFNQNKEVHDYDVKNNETESIDPYVQSVSKRYDTVGNLLYQTNPMSVSDNLLPNSGFEYGATWPDYWKQGVEYGRTAQFAWATNAKFGTRSISISNPTGWAIVYQTINFSIQDTYIFSGYVKTAATTGKAYLKVEYFDASNTLLGQRNSYGLTGTHEWTRLQTVISDIPAGTVTLRVSAALDAGQGTAYFDAIQFEKGNVVSAYNLIDNSSFEKFSSPTDLIPQYWSTSGNVTSADGRYQKTDSMDPRVYVGNDSFKLTGEKGKNKYLVQRIPLSGDANTKMTLSGWSYQEGADPAGGDYALQVGINYTDGTTDWRFANDFSKTMQGWQHLSVEVEPAKDKTFQSIDVYLLFYNQTGAAWFDAIRLEIGPSHTSFLYDAGKNYLTSSEDPLGNTVIYSYDFFGNRTVVIDGNGNKTTNTYNAENELTSVTDAKGFITSYLYDGEGNLTEVTNAKGFKQTYLFNELNQLSKWTDALNRSTTFEIDKFGNRTKVRNSDTTTVSNAYDIFNRLISISYNDVKQFDLEYDLNDNITKVTKTNGPITTFTYDLNNRLKSETEGVNSTSYSYDGNSNIKELSIPGGSQTSFIYNKLNLLRSLLKNNSTIANYIYNESGQVQSIYFTNGTYASFEYNGANQLVSLTNYNVNGIVMERFLYTFATNGNIMSVQTTKGTVNYQYDQLNQLTQETLLDGTMISYEYDSVGNRTKKTVTKGTSSTITTYSFNQANQLISENNQPYLYDLNGNLVDNGKSIYTFNADNRLIEVKEKATGNTVTFSYDYQGRRKTMTTTSGTVTFHYDQGNNVIFETDQSGVVLVEYTWDHENRPVTMIKNSLTYYYHLNGHGDVVALTDKDGNNVASYTYDAWGNITSSAGTIKETNPYRYAGYRYDEITGLYYLMARYYEPSVSRFLTKDTFEGFNSNPLTLNQYAFANNNPVMYVDPNGQFSWSLAAAWLSLTLAVIGVITALPGYATAALAINIGILVYDIYQARVVKHYSFTSGTFWKFIALDLLGVSTGAAAKIGSKFAVLAKSEHVDSFATFAIGKASLTWNTLRPIAD
ncbi:DNRLRE domain-containing protein, partial [Neobacillus drentensis]